MSSRSQLEEGMRNDDDAAVEEDAPPLLTKSQKSIHGSEPEALPPLRASRGSRGEHPFDVFVLWQTHRRASFESSFAHTRQTLGGPLLFLACTLFLKFIFKQEAFFFAQVSTL